MESKLKLKKTSKLATTMQREAPIVCPSPDCICVSTYSSFASSVSAGLQHRAAGHCCFSLPLFLHTDTERKRRDLMFHVLKQWLRRGFTTLCSSNPISHTFVVNSTLILLSSWSLEYLCPLLLINVLPIAAMVQKKS